MKTGCESKGKGTRKSVQLPVLNNPPNQKSTIAKSRTSRWRALALTILYLLIIAHIIQWRYMGSTVSPIEPSETMYTLQQGAINAGFIFFNLAIISTMIFGRFVCGWGCHIVALQDFCAWLLRKVGLTPKPFRSRLLVFVPLIAALYMFVWPTLSRAMAKPANEPLIPQFTNHLITSDFWATFPPVWIAIPFLFICGFVTVYFLGSKGFCTYACPYGGFFVLADKVAPGKIRVTDDCNQCGHCTATCMANVQVHAEVAKYGMVIDPGCMKHMDCISVCPNDALYFGFGKPSVAATKPKHANKKFALTWPEEIGVAIVFAASFFAVWDVYQVVPMLMALGIASITTFLAFKSWRLVRSQDAAFYKFTLRSSSGIQRAGWAFLGFAVIWIGWNAHSGYVRYHERAAAQAFQSIQIPDELALAQANPSQWVSPTDRANLAAGRAHFYSAFDGGFLVNKEALSKLAWVEYLSGNTEQALKLLGLAAKRQEGQGRAMSLYYRGAILNRLARYDEALVELNLALAERPDLVTAREEAGESLWQLGRRDEAVAAWDRAVKLNPALPVANNLLAGAWAVVGRADTAGIFEKQADRSTPPDPYFHYMLGLRLENLRMNTLAEKHFQEAIKLDPKFRGRRSLNELNRF